MNHKEMLDEIESIESKASRIEQDIKAYVESDQLKEMFDDLFETIEAVRGPLFDLVNSGKLYD